MDETLQGYRLLSCSKKKKLHLKKEEDFSKIQLIKHFGMSFCYLAIIVALFSPPAYNYASIIKKGSSTVS